MKTMRKWLAFMLAAGLMVSALTVFAEGEDEETTQSTPGTPGEDGAYGSGGLWSTDDSGKTTYFGQDRPDSIYNDCLQVGDVWQSNSGYFIWTGNGWGEPEYVDCNSGSESEPKSALEKEEEERQAVAAAAERAAQAEASREAVRLVAAAMDEGFANTGDMYIANQKSMSAGEFYNNAVVSTPGIENAVTVGQGGNLVVNGQVTNMSATISKVTNRAYVDSVRVNQEGTVLNVVEVSYPAVEATINFYMPGVAADANLAVVQYNAGTWVDVEVAEVRDDHVVLNMKGNGVIAFIAK